MIFCTDILGLEINNDEIYRNDLINNFSSNYKSEQHDKIILIFENYGPILDIEDLNELAEIYEVKRVTLFANLMWSPKFVKLDRAIYALNNYMDYKVKDKYLKIDLNSIAFDKSDAIPFNNKGRQYQIQIQKGGEHIKFTENPRPLRKIDQKLGGGYGVVYKKEVYKIINQEDIEIE